MDVRIRNTVGSTANIVGRAGEFLVCAELAMAGYECFLAEGRLPYDIIADICGTPVRIQVKTTSGVKACPQRKHHTPVYMFNARRVGKMQRKAYEEGQTDLIAYVALDRRLIAFMRADRIVQSTTLRIRAFEQDYACKTGMFIEDYPLAKAVDELFAPGRVAAE